MAKQAQKEVFIAADNVYSPIGKTTSENFASLKSYKSGVKQHQLETISSLPFYAALFGNDDQIASTGSLTKFERLIVASVSDALSQTDIDIKSDKTVLIVSTTKGNIDLLGLKPFDEQLRKRIALTTSAQLVGDHFGFKTKPVVVSNACISGVLAIVTAMRLLREGLFENAIVTGADLISKFILSGFQSFQALSAGVCRPFDQSHDGLNLGEGAATIMLSTQKKYDGALKVKGGAISNDANHISGPSRTGEELALAITQCMDDAGIRNKEIDFISAHGTATVYNDEMEARAMKIAGLDQVPLNSLKGYYGHTLGAAGLIEAVISMESLREGLFLATPGFETAPENSRLNVSAKHQDIRTRNFLKTASGFGGCNGALVIGE